MAADRAPSFTYRAGKIVGQIFANQGGTPNVWYSVTVHREYDKDGETFRAHSFGRDDLLPVAEVLKKCWEWIVEL